MIRMPPSGWPSWTASRPVSSATSPASRATTPCSSPKPAPCWKWPAPARKPGAGIGTLLTRHGLAHARDIGHRDCLADWRSANLLASRFWPSQGFQPAAYRLSRRIDTRISWGR